MQLLSCVPAKILPVRKNMHRPKMVGVGKNTGNFKQQKGHVLRMLFTTEYVADDTCAGVQHRHTTQGLAARRSPCNAASAAWPWGLMAQGAGRLCVGRTHCAEMPSEGLAMKAPEIRLLTSNAMFPLGLKP